MNLDRIIHKKDLFSPDSLLIIKKLNNLNFFLGLSLAVLIASFIFGGVEVYIFSPRTYILGVFGIICAVAFNFLQIPAFFLKKIKIFFIWYVGYIAFQAFTYHLHGMPISGVIHKMASTHILAILFFFVIALGVTKERNLKIVTTAMIVIVLFSMMFAFLEWIGIHFVRDVMNFINPRFSHLRGITASGFAMHSVSLGYQVICIGPFLMYFILTEKSSYVNYALIIFITLALYSLQSRSVVLSYLFALSLLIYYLITKKKPIGLKALILILSLIFVLTLISFPKVGNFASQIIKPVWINTSLNIEYSALCFKNCDKYDYELNSTNQRLVSFNTFFNAFESPMDYLVGPGVKKYFSSFPLGFTPVYPHNVFLNAGIISGIPMLFLSLYLYILLITFPMLPKKLLADPFLFCCCVSLVAQFVNSNFHNESIFSSSVTLMLILALSFGRIMQLRNDYKLIGY
jgi:hypothetical protein